MEGGIIPREKKARVGLTTLGDKGQGRWGWTTRGVHVDDNCIVKTTTTTTTTITITTTITTTTTTTTTITTVVVMAVVGVGMVEVVAVMLAD